MKIIREIEVRILLELLKEKEGISIHALAKHIEKAYSNVYNTVKNLDREMLIIVRTKSTRNSIVTLTENGRRWAEFYKNEAKL